MGVTLLRLSMNLKQLRRQHQLDDGIRFLDMDAVLEMEGDEELHFFPSPSYKM